jgi:L-threonylcarbamoyladenylate synthase
MYVSIDEAVKKLNQGEVVAVPTETVYGLAAIISNDAAIKKIFETKKRPFFDPLIVHVKNKEQAKLYSANWSVIHDLLTDKFWPGPLTLVVPKVKVSDLITSGLTTVGLRCPNHKVALEVLNQLNEPFAAPSANLFGKTSPTQAKHVEQEFSGHVSVVDGGASEFGIESTIIAVNVDDFEKPKNINISFLRLGSITQNQIKESLKYFADITNAKIEFEDSRKNKKILAPGQVEHHYMPEIPILWVSENYLIKDLNLNANKTELELTKLSEWIKNKTGKNVGKYSLLNLNGSPVIAARELYSKMRECCEKNSEIIICVKRNSQVGELWESIHDRLSRAATFKILQN